MSIIQVSFLDQYQKGVAEPEDMVRLYKSDGTSKKITLKKYLSTEFDKDGSTPKQRLEKVLGKRINRHYAQHGFIIGRSLQSYLAKLSVEKDCAFFKNHKETRDHYIETSHKELQEKSDAPVTYLYKDVTKATWKAKITELHNRGIYFPPEMEKSPREFLRLLHHYNLRPTRFKNFKILSEVIKNRLNIDNPQDKRPVALLVYSKSDNGGAFVNSKSLEALVNDGSMKVLYYEVATEQELEKLSQTLLTKKSVKTNLALLEVAAHGFKKSMILGYYKDKKEMDRDGAPIRKVEDQFLDTSDLKSQDLPAFKQLLGLVKHQLFLNSCSTGSGGKEADNLANNVSQYLPKGTEVISSQVKNTTRKVAVTNGRLTVTWSHRRPHDTHAFTVKK